ncbi:MAG: 2-amino-4-hydroxy-6-hydroxymethyldihydropteridine diphosphokinase [Actinobacteria bacterium]|nr:2-amino-4-hydroxy-6-hydroxymethyldihydropteridine diphosphokinase [Actinomycetota bacterium]NDI09387.1 2-amino-4-hydroxy-6-hydroxymethyldihydropteridine diphosphokinase [Actinomycetota bacterium]
MRAVIALGSNLGDRESYIQSALKEMATFLTIERVSTLIETEPVGGPPQGDYLNAVVLGECELEAEELLKKLMEIEKNLGRVREEINGPRTIDLDIISMGDLVIQSENLSLPHPRAHLRRFVLEPWLEVDPEAQLVGRGSVKELLRSIKPS